MQCDAHSPWHGLLMPAAPVAEKKSRGGRKPAAADGAAALPKKWTIRWTEAPLVSPATVACPSCDGILELYDAVLGVGWYDVPPTWIDKVHKCRTRTLQYMGHFLRCAVQQHHISEALEAVVANPSHAHVIVDFKVLLSPNLKLVMLAITTDSCRR